MRITLACIAFTALASSAFAQESQPASATLLSAKLAEQYSQTFAILQADFPEDYKTLTTAITEIELKPIKDEIKQSTAFALMTDLRKKFRHRMPFAPPAEQTEVLLKLAEFHEAVFKQEGPKLCGSFAMNGAATLFEANKSDTYAQALDNQSAAYFKAVVAAIETPDYHGAANKNDWSAVLGSMVGAGAPERYLAVLATNDPNQADRCPALAAMFRAAALLPGAEGERARADLVQNVTGY